LIANEPDILRAIGGKQFSQATDFPEWPSLHLSSERIQDAIVNRELPVGQNGITIKDGDQVEEAKLTIRHVDLKDWVTRRYPEEKPEFLFGQLERNSLGVTSVESIAALTRERDTLKNLLAERDEEINALRVEVRALLRGNPSGSGAHSPGEALSARAERALLHIIGGQLALLLGKDPSGKPHSRFRTQEDLIAALTDQYGQRLGLSKSTLEAKFAAAKRMLSI
jgi:hypothetical protein